MKNVYYFRITKIITMKKMLLALTILLVNFCASVSAQSTEYIKGQQDAITNYPKKHTGAGGTCIVTLVTTPVLGLIPAVICSATKPSIENLGMPQSELSTNPEYVNGYQYQARKLKSKKVWTGYVASTVVWAVLVTTLSAASN